MIMPLSLLDEIFQTNDAATGKHCTNRQLEWSTTSMLLSTAIGLLCFPGSLEAGPFRLIGQTGMGSTAVGFAMLIFGVLRAVALYANGHWQPHGAYARTIGSLAGAVIWFEMFLALALLWQSTGQFYITTPIYGVLVISEFLSCYRAAFDERRYAQRRQRRLG